jgi:CheY-like chemotaxis protein
MLAQDTAMTAQRPALIVVVEDDATVREWLVDLLTDEGYRVVACQKDEAALATIASSLPDLVLLDLLLHRYGYGWTILRSMRRQSDTARIPLIALTADGNMSDAQRQELAELRCLLLRKPVDTEDLLAHVRRALVKKP